MSRQARRFERNSNTRVRKVIGESGHQPKQKFVEDRGERARNFALVGKTANQKQFLQALTRSDLVVGEGASGVGKSFLAISHAAKLFLEKKIDRIVLVRCYQPLASRTVGFLSGSANEKLRPYMAQQISYIENVIGKAATDMAISNGDIELCLLEAVRGRDFTNCVAIVDEAQLLIPAEVQALVTRIGTGCQMIVIGDSQQADKRGVAEGLKYLRSIIDEFDIEGAEIVNFTIHDCQRSGITKQFLQAFDVTGYL